MKNSTPCYIDFNNIIPMPKDLLIEASTSGEFGMKYLKAMQRKPFNSPDDLKVIQWMEGLTEEGRKERYSLEYCIWKIKESTVIPLGTSGLSPTGVQTKFPRSGRLYQ